MENLIILSALAVSMLPLLDEYTPVGLRTLNRVHALFALSLDREPARNIGDTVMGSLYPTSQRRD